MPNVADPALLDYCLDGGYLGVKGGLAFSQDFFPERWGPRAGIVVGDHPLPPS